MTVFARGRRAFSIAAILMILTAVAHTMGSIAPPGDPEHVALVKGMSALRIPVGLGMEPSLFDIYLDLTFTMSVCLAGLGLLNLVLAGSEGTPAVVLRRVSWVNLAWMAALVVLAVVFHIAPMLISGVLIMAVIGVSLTGR
ncbi:MAG: hypothetical protein FJW40_25235 [Acidobacteria bacterium]|nr:hypothetical protein [Acidobacteriota bacterium]